MSTPTLIGESSPTLIDVGPLPAQLPALLPTVRELNDAELRRLMDAAEEEGRLAMVALLSGVSPEELGEMRWADIDADANLLRIARPAPREIAISSEISHWLFAIKQSRGAQAEDRWLKQFVAGGSQAGHVESIIAYAAHDAALEYPAEITPAVIRHTYIAFLVRQGIRFSELARIVGPLPTEVTAMYGAMAMGGNRRSLETSERVMPVLGELARLDAK
jgi:integrase